jgi:enediyne biosynthesis protein E4
LINKGSFQFEVNALPPETQFSSMKDAVVINANNDNLPDILIAGNYYDPNIEMGRYDADYGTVLINKGSGKFIAESINGLSIKGQVRHIKPVTVAKQQAYILVRNSDSTMIIRFLPSK